MERQGEGAREERCPISLYLNSALNPTGVPPSLARWEQRERRRKAVETKERTRPGSIRSTLGCPGNYCATDGGVPFAGLNIDEVQRHFFFFSFFSPDWILFRGSEMVTLTEICLLFSSLLSVSSGKLLFSPCRGQCFIGFNLLQWERFNVIYRYT